MPYFLPIIRLLDFLVCALKGGEFYDTLGAEVPKIAFCQLRPHLLMDLAKVWYGGSFLVGPLASLFKGYSNTLKNPQNHFRQSANKKCCLISYLDKTDA